MNRLQKMSRRLLRARMKRAAVLHALRTPKTVPADRTPPDLKTRR